MTRTMFRRGSRLQRVLSVWVTLAFVLSLTNVAYAAPPEPADGAGSPVETVAPAPGAPAVEVPAEPVVEQAAPPIDVTKAVPVKKPGRSVEAGPITGAAAARKVVAARTAAAKAVADPSPAKVVSTASLVPPVTVGGNPSLGSLGVRVDEEDLPAVGASKSYTFMVDGVTAHVTITMVDNGNGEELAFTSDWPITKVVAKGGSGGANVYTYSPGVLADDGIHTPANPNGKWADFSHVDFYFAGPASLKVYKYEDLDRDGIRDDGEPLLSGWTFILKQGDKVIKTATTGSDGKAVFSNIPPGAYVIYEEVKDGWVVTTDPYPVPVELSSCECTSRKIGNARVYDLSALKFYDADGDGKQDEGEKALAGWTIRLWKDGQVIDTKVTGDDGKVVFADLAPGTYQVDEVLKDGWFNTTTLPMTVKLCKDTCVKIGNKDYADIKVLKFFDADGDGMQGAGEQGLADWTIRLWKDGVVIDTAVTDANGMVAFENLMPGSYQVDEVLKDGWYNTTPLPVDVSLSKCKDAMVKIGNRDNPDLTVEKFNDLNADGMRGDGEPVLEGWTIRLWKDGLVIDSAVTGTDGQVTFENIAPGAYQVDEVLADGWFNTTELPLDVLIVAGQDGFVRIGNAELPDLTVVKYFDDNGNGMRDEGEEVLPGWTIRLWEDGSIIDEMVTGDDGTVVFEDLDPTAYYQVDEVLKDGWYNVTELPIDVHLSDAQDKTIEIGNNDNPDLVVLKFFDANANGIRDENEPVLPGFEFSLSDEEGVVGTATSGDDGRAVFADIPAGEYKVDEMGAEGWFSTTPLPVDVVLVENQDVELPVGNAELPDLSVLKFHDIDRDGERDEGEPVLPGWTFELEHAGPVAAENGGVRSAITNAEGIAVFTDVVPGSYLLDEVVQDGWYSTMALPIAVEMVANQDVSYEVGNTYDVTKSFELTYPNLPEGAAVWVRYSVDGGEAVLQQLSPTSGGFYGFDLQLPYNSVISGEWLVSYLGEVIQIAEFGPETLTEDLVNRLTYDPIVGGVKYDDFDGDGMRDEDEPGLSGWTINLYRMVSVNGEVPTSLGSVGAASMTWQLVASTVTGEGGSYQFLGLPPGTYYVEEVMQDGWEQTDAPDGPFEVFYGMEPLTGLDFGNAESAPFTDTELEKEADKTTAKPGDVITYTLTYRNVGDEALEVVTITDDYDERYITPLDFGDGEVSNGKIIWKRFNLDPGEQRTITYTMQVIKDMPKGTTIVDNTAVIDPFGASDTWTVKVTNPSEPEEEEEFLPFTGADFTALAFALLAALGIGIGLRRLGRAR